jgi:hypothetical protein
MPSFKQHNRDMRTNNLSGQVWPSGEQHEPTGMRVESDFTAA